MCTEETKWKSERTKRMDDDGNETRSRGYGSKRDQRTTFSKEVTQFGRGLDSSLSFRPVSIRLVVSEYFYYIYDILFYTIFLLSDLRILNYFFFFFFFLRFFFPLFPRIFFPFSMVESRIYQGFPRAGRDIRADIISSFPLNERKLKVKENKKR